MSTAADTATGRVTQVTGAVGGVEFAEHRLPRIYNALRVTNPSISDEPDNLVLEVAQHLGNNTVRAVAMDTTDGLRRGVPVTDTGDVIRIDTRTGEYSERVSKA